MPVIGDNTRSVPIMRGDSVRHSTTDVRGRVSCVFVGADTRLMATIYTDAKRDDALSGHRYVTYLLSELAPC